MGSAVVAEHARLTRFHPMILNSDPTLVIGKVSGALQHSTFPSSNWEHLPSSFSAPSISLHAEIRRPQCQPHGRVGCRREGCFFFLSQVSLPTSLTTRFLEYFPRGTGCCALICYREAWFATLSCCTCIRLTRHIILAVTRHCSCIGGVLHPGISDSWFFRR